MPDANILSDLNSPKARFATMRFTKFSTEPKAPRRSNSPPRPAGSISSRAASRRRSLPLHLPRIRETSKDDNDFWRAIFGQVKRAILDRLDKRRARSSGPGRGDRGGGHEAFSAGPGVGTQAADRETVSALPERVGPRISPN